jgi:DNA-directed RNA polymerase subunit RPC12/RpoP
MLSLGGKQTPSNAASSPKPAKPKASPAPASKKTAAAPKNKQQQQQQQKAKPVEAKPKKQPKPEKKAKVPVYKCGSCNSSFGASMSLEQHQEAKKHWSCSVCSRAFNSGDALDQHQTDSDHMQLFCQVCSGGPFKSQKSCDDHKSAIGHWNCPQCDSLFKSEQALTQHQVDLGHYEDDSSNSSSSESEESSEDSDSDEEENDSDDDEDGDEQEDGEQDWDSSEETEDIFGHLSWDSVDRMFSEKVLDRERQLASSRNQPERVADIAERMNVLKPHFVSETYRQLVREVINYDEQLLAQLDGSDPTAVKGVKERLRIMEAELSEK